MYVAIVLFLVSASTYASSTCFGSTSAGRLENACRMPSWGANYKSYSSVLWLAGRTYLHCDAQAVVVDAYASLAQNYPSYQFVYGETGNQYGGRFKPHKTHQNGLSVDFMVPVKNSEGESVPLPTHAFNRYGYDIEFTLAGEYKDLELDYEAMAEHLLAIKKAAAARGVGIWRVLFDPKMQSALKQTKAWSQIADLNFSKKRSWVRHDDHYHIDFVLPCKQL